MRLLIVALGVITIGIGATALVSRWPSDGAVRQSANAEFAATAYSAKADSEAAASRADCAPRSAPCTLDSFRAFVLGKGKDEVRLALGSPDLVRQEQVGDVWYYVSDKDGVMVVDPKSGAKLDMSVQFGDDEKVVAVSY